MSGSRSPIDSPRFRLRTFGGIVLERRDEAGIWTEAQRGGKVLGLLAYLSALEGRSVAREGVADLLWGDDAPATMRGSLRQAIYELRRLLGTESLAADRHRVSLVPGVVQVDREMFLEAHRAADIAAMLVEYQGVFCAQLEIGGARAFGEWVEGEQRRLELLLIRSVDSAARLAITSGDAVGALEMARRLFAAAHSSSQVHLLLFDALVSTGGVAEASQRLAEHAAELERGGLPTPPEVGTRLARIQKLDLERFAPSRGVATALGQRLVGREKVLTELLSEADASRERVARRVILSGPAGMGKTRLLEEVEVRLRLRGARIVRVRLLPGMREVPYAALTDLVRALSSLPGALGVSERSASELVALAPDLDSLFPNVKPQSVGAERAHLARRSALSDLLASISEDRLVVVVIDDLHYADRLSLQLLSGAPRSREARLLELWGTRPTSEAAVLGADRVVALLPLTGSDARSLLAEVAPLPEASWTTEICEAVAERARGVPRRMIQMLRAGVRDSLIGFDGNGWWCANVETLIREFENARIDIPSLGTLTDTEKRALHVLACWSRPLDERDLHGILDQSEPGTTPSQIRLALNRLEELGFVESRDTSWHLAHESVAESIVASGAAVRTIEGVTNLIRYWSNRKRLTVGTLEHLAFLCGSVQSLECAGVLVREAASAVPLREAGVHGRLLAARVANAAGRDDWKSALLGSVGLFERLGNRGRMLASAIAACAAIALLWLAQALQPRLVLEAEPLVEGPVVQSVYELSVQPRVMVIDGFGRQIRKSGFVRVRGRHGKVVGDTVAPLAAGSGQFKRLTFIATDSQRAVGTGHLEFRSNWYVRGVNAPVRGLPRRNGGDAFRVVEMAVNGVVSDPRSDHVARLGDTLRFDLTFEYSTSFATQNYLVGASPTWGDRQRSFVRLAGLPSPVENAWRTVTFSIPPPTTPGRYHVVILFAADGDVANLFSATNWAVGSPIWNDGNDVVDLSATELDSLASRGWIETDRYLWKSYSGRQSELRVGDSIIVRGTFERQFIRSRLVGTAAAVRFSK